MADSQSYLAFMRVTILGPSKSGKSSLINNVVNNAYTPAYSKTTEASLYYTTIRIVGEQDSLLEIEDTFGSGDVGDVTLPNGQTEEREISRFFDFWWPYTQLEVKKEQDALKAKSTTKKDDNGYARNLERPLSVYKAPVDGAFKPLTRNRMGFLVVFDANDEDSYKEGVRVYEALKEYHEKKNSTMKPIINFVANKIDKDPTSDVFKSVTLSAKAYCDFNGVPLRQVSALQYKGVKRLFRNLVQDMRANQLLWQLDLGVGAAEDEYDAAKCAIM